MTPRSVWRPLTEANSGVEVTSGVDGVQIDMMDVPREVDRVSYRGALEFSTADGEELFGLGQHEEGFFSLRGTRQHLYQHNLKISLPVLLSSRGYALLVDCGSAIDFEDRVGGYTFTCSAVDRLEFYVILGPGFDALVAGLQELTGHPPLLPKALLGYVQSKERYVDQSETLDVVKEFGRRQIPLDVITLDWRTWPDGLWGQKTLDPERFPEPESLVDDLHSEGVDLMLSVWPKLSGGGEDERELRVHAGRRDDVRRLCELDVDLADIPLFVRAGSIVPMQGCRST